MNYLVKMRTFRQHLLLCILIILLSRNAAEKSPSDEEIFTQNADISQDNGLRLPTSIKPVSYEIMLIPKLEDFTFEGIVKINADVTEDTDKITLHVGKIDIITKTLLVNDERVSVSHKYENITEKYTLSVYPQVLKSGSKLTIAFTYKGVLNDNMIGFYKSSYFEGKDEKWLAATQFQTTHARHAFPCFDEPSFKAKFTIRISREYMTESYKCLSNMPMTPETIEIGTANEIAENDLSSIWDTASESHPMSTYLVAFVISELDYLGDDSFKVWAKPSVIDQASYALQIGIEAIQLFNKKFGQPYQLPKLDMVAVPDFAAGAMENWGLVTYRESRMLYDKKESSALAEQSVVSVILHELSHMWFGNSVTPSWWSYLWLSEGFARYFQYFGTAELKPSWNMKEQFVIDQHQAALIVDGFESSRPLTRSVTNKLELGGVGDSITYSKGASIIRMMDHTFGTDLFNRALDDYLKTNQEKSVDPTALWTAIQQQVDISEQPKLPATVQEIMESWTTKAGYPVINVKINENGDVQVNQERFFLRDPVDTSDTWWVPLTWTTQNNPNFDTTVRDWLSIKNKNLNFQIDSEEWIIFNAQSSGFYRVNYDSNGWQRIFNSLNNKLEDIHVLNRAGIVDDLFNLARAKYQDYETVLQGLTYLQQEKNYLPFKAAFNGFDYLNKRFAGSQDYSLFKFYIRSLINNRRQELGYDDMPTDDRLTVLLRQEMNKWACNLDDEECITSYVKKFNQWRKDDSLSIKPNERATAYCVAIRHGSSADWDFLWGKYLDSNHVADQLVIINALGCSQNPIILEKYLKYAISGYQNNRIRKQDSASVFAAVYNSGLIGAKYVLDFVDKHYKEMEEYYGGQSTIATILNGASQHFSTPILVEKFEKFVDSHKTELAPILNSLQSSLEIAQYDLRWFNYASPPIIQWLYKYATRFMIRPTEYFITIIPDLVRGTFSGEVKIMADNVKSTNRIDLHSAVSEIKTVKVNEKIVTKNIEEELDILKINLDEPVSGHVSIEITYVGSLNPPELRGFYRSSYEDANGKPRWLAATHLEPVGARKMFPCIDEPEMKAYFTLTAIVPPGYHAVSNMEVHKFEKINNNKQWSFTFYKSEKMSTYLVAVIISDFEFNKDDKFAVLARPNAINQTEYALSVISPLVTFFEEKFKHQYPISKLSMAALPDFPSGAGENWGLLTYRESNLLHDENHSSITSKQAIINVIAHEISHQWFGNLVTPKWWKYLWLNEGFARYFEYHAPARVFDNETSLELQFVVDQVFSAFGADSSQSSHALTSDVFTSEEIRSLFDTITYNKGASILRMMEKTYGTDIFYAALVTYLDKRQYDVTTPEVLYESLQEQVKNDSHSITTIWNSWTTQPGYPIVYVEYKNDDNKIHLKQERFYFKKDERDSTDVTWHIPLTLASVERPEEFNNSKLQWFTDKETTISIDSLTIFNVQSGFYRVNYEEKYWEALINQLKKYRNTIPEINRAAIIDDVMNLARADYIDYSTAISATMYLSEETNYLPWRAFFNNLPYLNNRFQGRTIENIYKNYLTSLITPLYTKLRFYDSENDDHLTKVLRMHTRKWACKLDIGDCRYWAAQYFQQVRQMKSIPPNYRDTVYCTAMRTDLTNNTFKFLWEMYLNSNVAADKLVILSSLACSQYEDVLKTLLMNAVTGNGIRYQDSAKVFSNVYDENLTGVNVVMKVIQEHYDALLSLHFNDYTKIGNIVSAIASRLSTDNLYQQYQSFLNWLVDEHPEFGHFRDSYLSTAEYEFEWYKTKTPIIFEQLDKLFSSNTYRLPNTLHPELYELYLTPHMENGTFNGKVLIHMNVTEETSSIVLNSHNLDISALKVLKNYVSTSDNINGELIKSSWVENDDLQQLKIYLKEIVKVNEMIMAEIEFTGTLNDNMQGFYRSSYVDSKKNQHWLATTQFEPTYARQAFPCFDEPAFKSKFIINIQRRKDYKTALSNMPRNIEQSRESENKDYVWDSFKVTEVMSPYLVAFVVSKFEPVYDNQTVNVWGRPEVAKYGVFAAYIGKNIIDTLEKFTGINYSLPKLDLIGIPDFAHGAMENWGLATFREYGLFYDATEISPTYEQSIITVIAHELVHMWFGDLVTCEWWEYIWLNEGFAEFLQWFTANRILPDYKFMDQFVVYELQPALAKDASISTHPMTNPIEDHTNIISAFDYVTYGKSASVLRMMFEEFGEESFTLALRDYLNQTAYGTANPTDLWESFEQYVSIPIGNGNISVEEIMSTWTNQPGYPVVHAKLDGDFVRLTQNRFLINGDKTAPEFYWIPINIKTSQTLSNQISSMEIPSLKHKLWLGSEPKEVMISSHDEWFIVNYEQTGFYRVNYDSEMWLKLIEELNSDRFSIIPGSNRAQIIDDIFNLARADYVKYNVSMAVSRYLKQETDHLPWKAFFNSISYVYERFVETEQNEFRRYILSLLLNVYNKLGFNDRANDTYFDRLNREMILEWACKLDQEDCTKKSVELFTNWQNSTEGIPPYARSAVYCTAIRKGTPNDWNFLWNHYLTTNFGSEKKIIINALGCSTNETVLTNYLQNAVKKYDPARAEIRKQDVSAVFASVTSASQLGANVTLNFLIQNYLAIRNYFDNWNDVVSLFQTVSSHISNQDQYNKLRIFVENNEIFPPKDKEKLKSAVTTADINLKWYQINGKNISSWLTFEMSTEDEKEPGGSTRIESFNIVFITFVALISYFLSYL